MSLRYLLIDYLKKKIDNTLMNNIKKLSKSLKKNSKWNISKYIF